MRRVAVAAALAMALGAFSARGQEVLLTEQQALREIFPAASRVEVKHRTFDSIAVQRLRATLGRPVEAGGLDVTTVFDSAGAFLGYAVVTQEIGKYRPITFMVGITPQLAVQDVAVMVYRESHGRDVKRRRFLDQYRGKTARDPVDPTRDIISISGATLSVRAISRGVKRVLAEVTVLYPTASTKQLR